VDRRSPWRGFLSAIAALAGLLGLASGSVALVGFAAGWAVLLALAFLASRHQLGGLAAERRTAPSAFEGDLVTVDLFVENHGRRDARFVVASDLFGAGLADRQSVLEPGPLPPLHRRPLSYRAFVARQWGLYTVGPLSVGGWDPLGLWFSQRELPRVDPFEVYPRAVEIESLSARGARATIAPREVSAAASGQSLLFRGVREFAAGDDVRRIHWPATARRGAPMVREFERDLQPVFALFLDLDRRGRAGLGRKSTLEYLVRVGVSLLWTAHRRGDVFSLIAEGDRLILLPPGQGELHLAAALHELVTARQTGGRPLVEVVDRHRDLLPAGATAGRRSDRPTASAATTARTTTGRAIRHGRRGVTDAGRLRIPLSRNARDSFSSIPKRVSVNRLIVTPPCARRPTPSGSRAAPARWGYA